MGEGGPMRAAEGVKRVWKGRLGRRTQERVLAVEAMRVMLALMTMTLAPNPLAAADADGVIPTADPRRPPAATDCADEGEGAATW